MDYAQEAMDRRHKGLRLKASRAAKRSTQKERRLELQEQLPREANSMHSVVLVHARCLLGITERNVSTLPGPPTPAEIDLAIQRGKSAIFTQPQNSPSGPSGTPKSTAANHTRAFTGIIQTRLRELGLDRFTFDWATGYREPFNQTMDLLFYKTLDIALAGGEYNHMMWSPEHNTHGIISTYMERYFLHLQGEWRLLQKDGHDAVEQRKSRQRLAKLRKRVCAFLI